MMKKIFFLWILIALLLPGTGLLAQVTGKLKMTLADGLEITLIRDVNSTYDVPVYQYLPCNLRLSMADGQPEFSFLQFREDSLAPVSGGLMHLLLVWGLSQAQMEEAEAKLKLATDSTAVLTGSLPVEAHDDFPTLRLSSDSEIGNLLNRKITRVPGVPVNAGSKVALAFSFNAEEALVMEKALQSPEKMGKLKVSLVFKPLVRSYGLPAQIPLKGNLGDWLLNLNKK